MSRTTSELVAALAVGAASLASLIRSSDENAIPVNLHTVTGIVSTFTTGRGRIRRGRRSHAGRRHLGAERSRRGAHGAPGARRTDPVGIRPDAGPGPRPGRLTMAARANALGRGRCPLCDNRRASLSFSVKNLACLTCNACNTQVFARSDRSDDLLRALILPPEVEATPIPAAIPAPAPIPTPAPVKAQPAPAPALPWGFFK